MANANTSQDFVNRIDLTALTVVSGSEMDQLIATAKPATDKGLIIVTQDNPDGTPNVPNPAISPDGIVDVAHWVNYRWTRLPYSAAGFIYHYTWNPTRLVDDPTLIKWELDEASALQGVALATQAQATADQAKVDAASALTTAQNAQNTANGLQGQITGINTSITQLVSQTNTNTTDIGTLKTEVASLQNPTVTPINLGGTGQTTIEGALQAFGIRYVTRNTYHIYEQFNVGVNGGDINAGIFTTRPLNTLVNAISPVLDGYVTLNNDFTFDLVKGLWLIQGTFPAWACNAHKAQLFDVSNGVAKLIGTSGFTGIANPSLSFSYVRGAILLAANTKFRIQHMAQSTRAGDGMGLACNFAGQVEVYGSLSLTYCGS